MWINAKMQTTRTDGQRRRTNGPVQTNEVRCHVPAPRCSLGLQDGSGQWWAVASCEGGVVRRHWHLCSCAAAQACRRGVAAAVSLADGALWPRGPRGPVRAPPSAHFRNREGSCRNPWVLGRRKLRPWDPCPYLRRRGQSGPPAPRPPTPARSCSPPALGTWLVYRRPRRLRYQTPDCHHSKSQERDDICRSSLSNQTASGRRK